MDTQALTLAIDHIIIDSMSTGVVTTGAGQLLGSESDGFAFSAEDDSLEIRDSSIVANNYAGSMISKFGAVRASAGLYFNAALGVQLSASGLRIDHNPRNAGVPHFLVKSQATNFLTYSSSLAGWFVQGDLVRTANATTAPDGTLTACKYHESSTVTGERNFYNALIPVPATADYTFSIFMKAAERHWAFVRLDPGGPIYGAWFDFLNGVVGTVIGVTASIHPAGSGWYRCVVTRSLTVGWTAYGSVQPTDADGTTTYTGVVNSGFYPWQAQLEQSSGASSPIPTVGTTVTRAADLPVLSTSILPYHLSLGTLYAWSVNIENKLGTILMWMSSDQADQASLKNDTAGLGVGIQGLGEIYDDFARIVSLYGGYGPRSNPHKIAFAWSPTSNNAAFDGALPNADDLSGVIELSSYRFQLGFGAWGADHMHGWIAEGLYLPRRMSNEELQEITAP